MDVELKQLLLHFFNFQGLIGWPHQWYMERRGMTRWFEMLTDPKKAVGAIC